MKKMIAALMCVLVALALAGCSRKNIEGGGDPSEGGMMQIPNPWTDCSSLDEAAKVAGFDIAIPGNFKEYPNRVYRAMEKSMIEVSYYDTDPSDENSSCITIRKGKDEGDISGDYNTYPEEETVDAFGFDVLCRGDKGLIYCAVWSWDRYSFSMTADKGMTKDVLLAAIDEMITVPG